MRKAGIALPQAAQLVERNITIQAAAQVPAVACMGCQEPLVDGYWLLLTAIGYHRASSQHLFM